VSLINNKNMYYKTQEGMTYISTNTFLQRVKSIHSSLVAYSKKFLSIFLSEIGIIIVALIFTLAILNFPQFFSDVFRAL